MTLADWMLLTPILGYCFWLVFRRKKKCSGNCQSCCGCNK